MSFVSKKPHFFKPVLPNFKNGLLIPISFIEKYLKGEKLEYAELRRCNRKWKVKITNERLLEEGWSKFWEDNEVKIGDFLVFRHEGGLIFDVLLFDHSTLLKPLNLFSPSPPLPCVKQEKILDDDHHKTQSPLLAKSGKHKFHGSNKTPKWKQGVCTKFGFEDKATPSRKNQGGGHPYFTSTLSLYSISKSILYIPMKFARSNGLTSKNCDMTMKDEKGRSWPLRLKHMGTHVSISKGFHHFIAANGLKEGDSFIIHLLHNGNKPLMKFLRLNKIPKRKQECKVGFEEENATNTDHHHGGEHPYFSSTLTPSNIHWSVLHIPMEFARSNGLTSRNCEMIMKDEKGKSWPMRLKHSGSHVSISRGFNDLLTSNHLKEGDSFIIHLLHNGHKPLMNFLSIREHKIGKVQGNEQIKRENKFD